MTSTTISNPIDTAVSFVKKHAQSGVNKINEYKQTLTPKQKKTFEVAVQIIAALVLALVGYAIISTVIPLFFKAIFIGGLLYGSYAIVNYFFNPKPSQPSNATQ